MDEPLSLKIWMMVERQAKATYIEFMSGDRDIVVEDWAVKMICTC